MILQSRDIADYPEGIVLPIDKPWCWTSADVIRKVKRAAIRYFGKRNLKVGHAGTLDPLATGLLLVCIGPACKRAQELQDSRKEYIAGVTLGAVTASYDLEKDLESYSHSGRSPEGVDPASPTEAAIRNLLPTMIGPQMQVAPLFSAKSVDGVRAYETARRLYREGRLDEGSDILHASPIEIYGLELLDYGLRPFPAPPEQSRIHVADARGCGLPTATIRVSCSKGTYIRALARDIGEALGVGGFLSSLRRTYCGGYTISDALTLDEVLASFNHESI